MIREVARCPYCGAVSAGVDDDPAAFVLAPDRADGRPCPHLAFVSVSLDVSYPGCPDALWARGGCWLWVRGEAPREQRRLDPLHEYVLLLAGEWLSGGELPATEFRVGGGTAVDREEAR